MTLLRTIPSTPRLCDRRNQLGSNDVFHAQHVTEPPGSQRNFLVVDSKTETSEIERAFQNFTQERKDIAVLLINQHVSTLSIYCTRQVQRAGLVTDTSFNVYLENRSQSASATASTHSPIPSQLSSKSPAKITPTTPRRTAFSSVCAVCLESKLIYVRYRLVHLAAKRVSFL